MMKNLSIVRYVKPCSYSWRFNSLLPLKDAILRKYTIAESTLPEKEADGFARAVRLDEIPPEFKHLKVLARGNTSIILEKDPETVIMITRDAKTVCANNKR